MLDLIATALLALAASCRATQYGASLTGAVTLACAVGLVSPLLRDSLLNMGRVTVLHEVLYVVLALAGALIGRLLALEWSGWLANTQMAWRTGWLAGKVFFWADTLSIALATAMGASLGTLYGLPPVGSVLLGIIAGTAGSILRDVCLGDTPHILEAEYYATSTAIGGMLLVALAHVRANNVQQTVACATCVFVLRWLGHRREQKRAEYR